MVQIQTKLHARGAYDDCESLRRSVLELQRKCCVGEGATRRNAWHLWHLSTRGPSTRRFSLMESGRDLAVGSGGAALRRAASLLEPPERRWNST